MPINIQSYLLALDIFALLALLMALTAAAGRTQGNSNRLLLALFALVALRSIALITHLAFGYSQPKLLGSLEIFSLLCIVLALLKPSVAHSKVWQNYARLGLAVWALALLIFGFTSLPWQPLLLLLALGSLPLVFPRYDKSRWTHTLVPLFLGLTALLSWIELNNLAQFLALMAYGTLVYAVFVETVIKARIQQQAAESLSAETRRIHAERQRLREVSRALSTAHSPTEALANAAQIIANNTSAEQIIILPFSQTEDSTGYIAAAHSADGSLHYTSRDNTSFHLADVPAILDALESQQRILITNDEENAYLKSLYRIWGESKVGPILLQPLLLKQQAVGILLMGNPNSDRLIPNSDVRLAQNIAPQLASMVVYQRQYQSLELQTEDFAAKLQLNRAEMQRLSSIIEAISDGVVVSDIEGKIQLANAAAQRILGKSDRQLAGKSISAIYGDIASDETIEKLATDFSRSNQPLSTYFERDELAVQGRLLPLRNDRQEWMGMVVLLKDISVEAAADKIKRDFVETISRELRTPLTTSRGYADLMLGETSEELTLQQQQFMNVIRGGIDKVASIVNNATQSLDHGTDPLKLDVQPVDIYEIIANAIQAAESAFTGFKKSKITTDIEPDIPPIQADPAKLQRAFENLLTNACRATDRRGQILLRAWLQSAGLNGQQSQHLIVSLSDKGKRLATDAPKWISDQDDAQPQNEVDKIVDSARTKCQEVKEIIEAHGGRVWIEPLEENGGVFHIALPI